MRPPRVYRRREINPYNVVRAAKRREAAIIYQREALKASYRPRAAHAPEAAHDLAAYQSNFISNVGKRRY